MFLNWKIILSKKDSWNVSYIDPAINAMWLFTLQKVLWFYTLYPVIYGEYIPDNNQWIHSTVSEKDIIISKLPGNYLDSLKKNVIPIKHKDANRDKGPIII